MTNSVQGILLLLVCGVIGAVNDEVKSMSVYEGESVTLHTDTNLLEKDKILWRFEEKGSFILLVEMSNYNIKYEDSIDVRLRDRLLISDTQRGDLTIKNMRVKYSGLYRAEINTKTASPKKTFNVTVKESPPYTDAEARDVKSESVKEGKSVTLHTDVQTQKGDLIQWRFGDKNLLIAKGDMEDNNISYVDDDERFSGRLKMNDQTGDLTITNIRTSNTGVYNLKIISRETKYKTFSVSLSGGGLSPGAITVLCIFFLLVIAAVSAVGVILYRRKKPTVPMMSVPEGDTLALTGTYSELQTGTQIEWKFKGRVIMTGVMTEDEVIRVTKNDDQQFRDRLKLNPYFGHLIIKNILKEDTGLYEVKITNNKETSHTKIQVNVIVVIEVPEGDHLAVSGTYSQLKTGTRIEWMFKDRVIVTGEMTENEGIRVIKDFDQQFKSRLKLNNNQFLYISNISKEDTGLYEVKITNKKQTLHFIFQVKVAAGYVTLFEGGNAHLHGADSVLKTGTQIVWKFKGRVIMTGEKTEDKGITEIYSDDQQFKDRLELGDHIGYLIIKNISKEDTGVYEVNITINKETTHNKTKVEVIDASTGEDLNEQTGGMIVLTMFKGDPAALRGAESELQPGTLIEWKFKDRVITTGVKTEDKRIYLIRSVDPQFNGRLKFDNSVGYLFINDISEQDSGVYEVKITNNKGTSRNKTHVIVIAGSPKEDMNRQKGDEFRLVPEEETLTLVGSHIGTQTGTQIEWKFNDHVIMTGEMTEDKGITEIHSDDQKFKGRLKLNPHFGHLIINNISMEDTGLYEVKVTHNELMLSSRFKVKVIDKALQHLPVDVPVSEGDCVTLPGAYSRPGRGSQIEWTFKGRVIMTGEMTMKGMTGIHSDDQQFKDRLGLDYNFGSLFIKNISKKDAGLYEGKITNVTKPLHFKIKVNVIGGSPKEDLNRQMGARTNRDEPEPTAGMPLLSV